MLNIVVVPLQKLGWSLRAKLGLAFGPVLACFILNGVISALLLFNIQTSNANYRDNSVYLEKVQRLDLAYRSELSTYSDVIFFTKVSFIRDSFKSLIVNEMTGDNLATNDESDRQFNKTFASLYGVAYDHFLELEDAIRAKDFDTATAKWQKFSPDFDKISQLLTQYQKHLVAEQSGLQQEVDSNIWLSLGTLVGLTLISLLFTVLTLKLADGVMVQPLNTLQRALRRVAEGDIQQQVEVANHDEIGSLALSFSSAVTVLQQVLRGVQIGESLGLVTRQLSEVSQQQAAGSTEQVTALTQVMTAMQELGHTAAQIADNAAQVAALTRASQEQTQVVAQAGQLSQERSHEMVEVVESTLQGVDLVSAQVGQVCNRMRELAVQAESVNKVVSLLGAIAGEVHLLALNAAIEAAGAGEYGERFKQVARQVKSLAERANQATVEATGLIRAVQQSSQTALSEAVESQGQVGAVLAANSEIRPRLHELEQSAGQVSQVVGELEAIARQVTQRADEIKLATAQQRVSNEQVIISARSVGAIASQTATLSKHTATSSSQLAGLSQQLQGILSQIQLAA
jgi:methyl-accepting chemotaxis protein